MRRRVWLVALVMAAATAPAHAVAPPDSCTSGPASSASLAQPHATDPAGDAVAATQMPEAGSQHYDLRAMWVGGGPGGYSVNIAVEALASPRHGRLLFDYGGDRWVAASFAADGNVTYEYGHTAKLEVLPGGYPREYPRQGFTTGRIDGSTISIDLPPHTTSGTTLAWEQVRAYQQAHAPVLGGLTLSLASVLADDFSNGTRCEVLLS